MQGYTDKVYSRAHKIYESPLSSAIHQNLHLENSFSASSDSQSISMELSRGLPLTITKEKCKNCQRLEKCLTLLTSQLLNIEKNILEKEQKLGDLLDEKTQSIAALQAKLENMNEKNHSNHFSSTFYTEADHKYPLLPQNLAKSPIQENSYSYSLMSEKKTIKHSFVSVYNVGVLPYKIRQKTQNRQSNQNISPNSQIKSMEKRLSRLQFENQTLKNYNCSLLAHIQKLRRRQ